MKWSNAEKLYNFIKENNVHRVLEFGLGIGCSTAVMALAFQDKGEQDWHIDTLEQYDKCIDLAKKLIPEELQKNITYIKADPIVWQTDKIPYQNFSVYKELPEINYDMLLNDGPSPFLEKDSYIDLPNGTIHKLVLDGKLKPGTKVIYDGRKQSLIILERYLADNFYITRVPQKGDDFYILERKDNAEIVFRDDILEAMRRNTNYFK
jgi:hypothetical protein